MKTLIFAGMVLALSSSCAVFNHDSAGIPVAATGAGAPSITAPVVVYKTKSDYSKKVPVTLSADKSRIIAYPAPEDIRRGNGSYTYPTPLKRGYLLDNRGIGPNTAFLKVSYEEYAALTENPSLEDLKSWILDADPILEWYRCPDLHRTAAIEAELNRIINNKKLDSLCIAAKE